MDRDGPAVLSVPDSGERDDLAAFAARVVRLDQAALVRLCAEVRAGQDYVSAWSPTPFDTLVSRSVRGTIQPADLTVAAPTLLAALAVDRAATVDPGPPVPTWGVELPPPDGWHAVDDVPAAELDRLAERGLALARENTGPLGPPTSLLDQVVLTVSAPAAAAHAPVKVPLRCLLALSGMGFLGAGTEDVVRVSATGSWMRLDARYGAVVRRRITALPLFVG